MTAFKAMVSVGVVVGLLAGTALANPSFSINGGHLMYLTGGVPQTFYVTESGSAGIAGMELYLEINDGSGGNNSPVHIIGLDIDGPGTVFNGNASDTTIGTEFSPLPDGTVLPPYLAIGMVTTNISTLATTGPGIAGRVTLFAPLGAPTGSYTITTNSSLLGPSIMVDSGGASLGFAQGTTAIVRVGAPGGPDPEIPGPEIPIPAPGAAMLGVIGLSIVGWVKRRMA